jgi:hypothetical protein
MRKKKSRKELKGKKKGLRNEVMDGKLMNLTFFHRSFHMYSISNNTFQDLAIPAHLNWLEGSLYYNSS